MKKLLLSAVVLLGFGLTAEAQTLSVDNNEFVALKGENSTLTINVGSATNVRDVQFDIVVPAGVTIGTPEAKESTYSVAISEAKTVTDGNQYTVILYSADAATGASAIDFPLTVADGVTPWATVSSSTSEGKWTNASAEEASATSTAYTFEIGLKGDVNRSGDVAFADAGLIYKYMENSTTPASLGAFAVVANLNGDSEFSLADAGLVYKIVEENTPDSSVKEVVYFDDVQLIWPD